MEFDWTTFTLEIINFLILVWILKRFLYRPVLDVIARRRAGIEKTLADAQQIESEANLLKQQNEQHLAQWETEKEAAHAALLTELADLRENKMAALDATIAEEAERRHVLDERRRREFERLVEEKGIALGAQFSAKLLSRLVSQELETKLYTLLLEDLQNLPTTDKQAVIDSTATSEVNIKVQSAFSLSKNEQDALAETLNTLTGKALPIEYSINPELIAGFQVDIGPWIMHANLRDELKFFSGALHHAD